MTGVPDVEERNPGAYSVQDHPGPVAVAHGAPVDQDVRSRPGALAVPRRMRVEFGLGLAAVDSLVVDLQQFIPGPG